LAASDLFDAIGAGDAGRVRDLVDADPAVAGSRGPDGVSAVLTAVYRRNSEIVDALREAHPTLDLFDAAGLGANDELAELIRGDPALARAWSGDGFTALHLAAYFGHPDTVGLLLGAGADATVPAHRADAVAPLHSAAAGRSAEVVRQLVEAGADPNARQAGGWTPLHAAAINGDDDIVDILLAAGADRSLANDAGTLPLDLANKGGHKGVVERLSAEA
jgi:ankyrin repeat protein